MRRLQDTVIGCFVLVVIAAILIGLAADYPWEAGTCIAVALVVLWARYGLSPKRCDICGNSLRRRYYVWDRGWGRLTKVCPHCNEAMRRARSKAGMRRFLEGSD